MKTKVWMIVGAAICVAASSTTFGQTRTFRTPAAIVGVLQGADLGGKPEYDFEGLAGHDLVNLALGTPLATVRTNEVLALEIACDSSTASLVVFDRTAKSDITTIATSSRIDVVKQQDNDSTAFPNRERVVAALNIAALGNSDNGLLGGYLTFAGRLYLDTGTGCPHAVLVDSDRRQDRLCNDPTDVKDTEDTTRSRLVAGRAHFVGVIDLISASKTNTVLVPIGDLSIRRQLLP